MIVYCPYCKYKEETMVVTSYVFWWKEPDRPNRYSVELECPKCHTRLRTSLPITVYKGKV